jgi:hypothetical protein
VSFDEVESPVTRVRQIVQFRYIDERRLGGRHVIDPISILRLLNGDWGWSTTNAEKVGRRQVRVDCFDIWEKEDDYDRL